MTYFLQEVHTSQTAETVQSGTKSSSTDNSGGHPIQIIMLRGTRIYYALQLKCTDPVNCGREEKIADRSLKWLVTWHHSRKAESNEAY